MKRANLPPGPTGLPLLGNIFQMPTETPWLTFAAWARKYGDVMSVSVLGQPIIFLTSPQAASDLLDRKSAIYSDRPELVFIGELVGYKESLPLCTYGDSFREQRKLVAEALGPRNTSAWRELEEGKVKEFLGELLEKPELFLEHIRLLVSRIAFGISHGYTIPDGNDPMALLAVEANTNFGKAIAPGAYLCDVLPILRYIPDWTGVRFKQEAKIFRKTMNAVRDDAYNALKAQVALGTAKPSFTTSLIQREENPTEAQELIYKWSSASVFIGGSDTSVSAIGSIFVALSLYPEVQKQAQEELDRVVGPDRLPSFKDQPNLPYLNAVVMEIHRWKPVNPLGVPHRCTQEDIYNGFRIPAGSIVFANAWCVAILHDEAVYPSPLEFIPERYLQEEKGVADGLNPDPRRFAFGYGRRVCPGKDLAEDSIFICAAMILATFNLTRPKSSVTSEYTSGPICHPLPFPCNITPRSRKAEALILAGARIDT
ncbi:cytochrome P450 [Mycena rosella]|uniref:Cytochrome P450 n=1 Tax=Mycena rosella TaxID=1033263 RepID=A0AAD7D3J2_MYCRO|nr:cytochrome P450 [Mycena rosella]